jgi:Wiskott-Aldrich syndrome protein
MSFRVYLPTLFLCTTALLFSQETPGRLSVSPTQTSSQTAQTLPATSNSQPATQTSPATSNSTPATNPPKLQPSPSEAKSEGGPPPATRYSSHGSSHPSSPALPFAKSPPMPTFSPVFRGQSSSIPPPRRPGRPTPPPPPPPSSPRRNQNPRMSSPPPPPGPRPTSMPPSRSCPPPAKKSPRKRSR